MSNSLAPDRQWRAFPHRQEIQPGDLEQFHESDTEWRVVEPPGDLTRKHDVVFSGQPTAIRTGRATYRGLPLQATVRLPIQEHTLSTVLSDRGEAMGKGNDV